jgi:pyruvate dehydrogenase E2 component (dihydrolipoamide acetyltransferase)
VIAEVETEKITNELEAPVSGVVSRILVAEGTEEIEVGTVLCVINEG